MAQTELSKQIKRINERLNALARKGYFDSEEYSQLTSFITALPHHTVKVTYTDPLTGELARDNNGNPALREIVAITNKKEYSIVDGKKVSNWQPMELKKLTKLDEWKNLSVGHINQRAKDLLKEAGVNKPTKEQIRETAYKTSSVHAWIKEYSFAIYGYTNKLGAHSLADAVHRSTRLTLQEVEEMYTEIVTASAEKRRALEDKYSKNNPDFR